MTAPLQVPLHSRIESEPLTYLVQGPRPQACDATHLCMKFPCPREVFVGSLQLHSIDPQPVHTCHVDSNEEKWDKPKSQPMVCLQGSCQGCCSQGRPPVLQSTSIGTKINQHSGSVTIQSTGILPFSAPKGQIDSRESLDA